MLSSGKVGRARTDIPALIKSVNDLLYLRSLLARHAKSRFGRAPLVGRAAQIKFRLDHYRRFARLTIELSIQIDYKGKVATLSRSAERTESVAGRETAGLPAQKVAGHLGFAFKPHNPPKSGLFHASLMEKAVCSCLPARARSRGHNLVVRARTDVMMVQPALRTRLDHRHQQSAFR
jgi:hypothetical protein